MKFIFRWGIAAFLLILSLVPVLAQDTVTLKPYTDKSYGLTGIVPAGWNAIGSGTYERDQSPNDVTVILQQTSSLPADKVLTSLLPRLGLTTVPQSVGTYRSTALNWTLYKVAFKTPTVTIVVDLALAEDSSSGKTFLLALQTSSADYDALHKSLFLPVLDALKPLPSPDELIRWLKSSLSWLMSLWSLL